VSARNESAEVAGHFTITATAAPGVGLDELETKIDQLVDRLAKEGVNAEHLKRIQTRLEAMHVRRMESVSQKTSSLCVGNMFTGNPNRTAQELHRALAVTPAQIQDALKRYIINKPRIALSVVPEGKLQMAASGRSTDQLAHEKSIDRTKRPASGPRPAIQAPVVWHDTWENGMKVTGTKFTEVPLTTLSLAMPAGRMHETMEKLGLSSLTAACMNEGTKTLDSLQFSQALEAIAANINVSSDEEDFTISLNVLNKNLKPAIDLMRDLLVNPRFDEKDFRRIKKQRLLAIDTRGENITGIAGAVWQRLMFGDDQILGRPGTGTRATVEKMTIDDVRDYYKSNLALSGARLSFVGDLDAAGVRELFKDIAAWKGAGHASSGGRVEEASAKVKETTEQKIYFVDKSGAAQSQVRIGHRGVAMGDPDYFPLTVLNYILGGAFSSRINMNLREQKGYTYGARSNFDAGLHTGTFSASAGVHTQYTKESVVEFMKELKQILDGVTEEELAFAKNALAQNFALQYESSNARLGMVNNIAKYGFKDDYPSQRLAELEKLTVADLKSLAQKYIHPDKMTILIVGDRSKVFGGLNELGMGDVTELDIDGAKK
jgi:zinc protease